MSFLRFCSRPVVIFLVGVVVLSLLLGGFFSFADPDYFWHYKTGEYVVENRTVPALDLFSFSMPDFPWVNHEWLSDAVLYWVESHAGQWWLGVFYLVLLFVAMLVLALRKRRLNWLDAATGFVGVILLLSAVGVRQQTYSILFFVILMTILERRRGRLVWLLPPLFLIWVNLHGGFVLGLGALVFYSIWESFGRQLTSDRGYSKRLAAMAFASVAATLANPYGLRIYEEVFRSVGDNFLARHISEWQPLIFLPHVALRFGVFLAFILVLLPQIRRRLPGAQQIFILVLFLAALRSFKYLPYFVLSVLPVLWTVSDSVAASVRPGFFRQTIIGRQSVWLVAAFVVVGVLSIKPDIIFKVSYPSYPSEEAVQVLRASAGLPPHSCMSCGGERVFNFYGWGGYLIRYAPERRYFIDGRMPSWRTKDTFVFGDYIDLSSCKHVDEIVDKYNLDTIFWPSVLAELKISTWLAPKELDEFVDKLGEKFFGQKPAECDFVGELTSRGWTEKFNDGNTLILQKP